jgi:putative two-component system response regulator
LVSLIRRAAPLHDVGKIGIPDAVLLKLGKLTDAEFALVKTHTTIGARILSGSKFAMLRLAEEIAFSHHEHWDGGGYEGLSGESIPLAGRIVTIADVFDALTQKRPYKAAWSIGEALAEIERQRGRQFDPTLVDAFLRVITRV